MRRSSRPSATLLLRRARVRAFLITDLKNIRYLSGLSVSAGCILVTQKGYELFVDSRYAEVAKKSVAGNLGVHSLSVFAHRLQSLPRVGIESASVTLERYAKWQRKYKNTKFVQTSDVIEHFRRSKSVGELRCIAHACRITRAVLRMVPTLLRQGITERELAWRLEVESRKRGAEGMAFDSIVAFGEHTSRPHHHPTDQKLRKGDLVQIDMGAKFDGCCSDFSRVYFTGTPTVEQRKALRALNLASAAAKKILKAGVNSRALDLRAREVLKSFGFDKEFSHALGHGLGLDIHEGITLSSKAPNQKLLKNEVITIEPGLYFEGQWGMRIEDTVVVPRVGIEPTHPIVDKGF